MAIRGTVAAIVTCWTILTLDVLRVYASDDGVPATVVDAELEGPGRNDSTHLSRHLQLNLTFGRQKVSLDLRRNDNIPHNLTVIVGQRGRLEGWSHEQGPLAQRSAFYFDVDHQASLMVEPTSFDNNTQTNTYSGTFHLGGHHYVIEPVTSSAARRRRRRSADEPDDAHVIFTSDDLQPENYSSVIPLPAEVEIMRTMERSDGSNTLPTKLSYVVEMLVAVDYRLYDRFYAITDETKTPSDRRTEALTSISCYFSHVVNGVGMRYSSINDSTYSVNVRLVGVYVSTTINDSQAVEQNRRGNGTQAYIQAQPALYTFVDWINAHKSSFPPFDQVSLVTSELMNGQTGNRISGMSYFKSICTQYSAVIVRDSGQYGTTQTIAHELGHNLGATHDGIDNTCSAADLHVMVASPGQLTDDVYKNPYSFSQCSVDEMRLFLTILTGSSTNCLLVTASQILPLYSVLPGQMFKPDTQCHIVLGSGAFFCGGQTNEGQMCRTMQCYHPQYRFCYTSYELRAFTGTSCGNNKWCQFGDCVPAEGAPTSPDSCIYGDAKIQLTTSGLYCSNITADTAWQCYDRTNEDFCCRTCASFRNSSRTGCEYGDKAPLCKTVLPSSCLDPYINTTCCSTCSVPAARSGCPNGDRLNNCSRLIDSNVKCYTYGSDCCATCAKFKTNITDCLYGDKDRTCAAMSQPQECYTRNQSCCQTCANSRSTNIDGCEWGDKVTGWCHGILAEQCYDQAKMCCETCHQYFNKTAIPGCEYGDLNRNWCISSIKYLHQCYYYASYCCATCAVALNGPPGCEYGDRDLSCTQRNCADPAVWNTCCRTCASFINGSNTADGSTTTSTTPAVQTSTSGAVGSTRTTISSSSSSSPTPSSTAVKTTSLTAMSSTLGVPQTSFPATQTRIPTTLPTTKLTTAASTPSASSSITTTTTTTAKTTTLTTPLPKTTAAGSPQTSVARPSATRAPTPVMSSTTSTTAAAPLTTPQLSTSTSGATTRVVATPTANVTRRVSMPTTSASPSSKSQTSVVTPRTSTTTQAGSQDCRGDTAWWCDYIQPNDCYDSAPTCCETCARMRVPVTGCEYGDHFWWCSIGNRCTSDDLRKSCCITCGTVADSSCLDVSASCSNIEPASCYNSATLSSCCMTCSKFKTGPEGCEYGDRQTWCKNLKKAECSFNLNDCCQTCS